MEQVKSYILEDLEKLNNKGLTKVYKFIRRDIIANISKQGSDIPVNSSVLLSCPFCGSKVILLNDNGYYGIQCQGLKKLLCPSIYLSENKKKVIKHWNTRAT